MGFHYLIFITYLLSQIAFVVIRGMHPEELGGVGGRTITLSLKYEAPCCSSPIFSYGQIMYLNNVAC